MQQLWIAGVALAAAMIPFASAHAEDDAALRTAAARVFQEAQKAQLMGRHQEAAEKYELADELIPTLEALRSALRARLAADDIPLAARHAEALATRCTTDRCRDSAAATLAKIRPELLAVNVECKSPCTIAVDGRPVITRPDTRHRVYVWPGSNNIEAIFEEGAQTLAVEGLPGGALDLSAAPPVVEPAPVVEAPPPPPPPVVVEPPSPPPQVAPVASVETEVERSGAHPIVPILGFGIAAGLGVATGWSIVDTRAAHAGYLISPTSEGWDEGRSRDLRTNVLLYSAVGTAALSSLIAIFWTDWGE